MPWILNSELAYPNSKSVNNQTRMLLETTYTFIRYVVWSSSRIEKGVLGGPSLDIPRISRAVENCLARSLRLGSPARSCGQCDTNHMLITGVKSISQAMSVSERARTLLKRKEKILQETVLSHFRSLSGSVFT